MGIGHTQKPRLLDEAAAMWPSLPFMAFGLWSAWSALTYSGSLWLSSNEVDGTYLSQSYILSTFACSVVFIAAALLCCRRAGRIRLGNRAVLAGGALAGAGCLLIVVVGPYYLQPVIGASVCHALFVCGAVASGLGTAVVGLKCGMLYGMLSPRKALIYTSLSQLLAVFVYLVALACPSWAPVANGPSLAGIVFFCALPPLAAALACVRPSTQQVGPGADAASGAAQQAPAPAGVAVPGESASAGPRRPPARADVPASRRPAPQLPGTFWRFVAFTFFLSMFASLPRSAVVTTHALASTVEGNNLLMILRAVTALVFIGYGVRASARGVGLGKMCSMLATFSAVIVACAAALGGLTNEWSLVIYLASSIFEFVMWCLLAFIVVQKRVPAVVVFGFGRGALMLGCGAGWAVGSLVMPLVPPGTPTTVFYVAMAGVMLLVAMGLFSERDYERLFSPVSEEELSLEDLFDLERRERELEAERAAEAKGERRGRFSRAVEEVAQAHVLSAREAEVLRCLAMGYGSDRIAGTMGVKVNTVRAHTHNVYVKLDVHSREELMRLVDDAVARQ